MRTKKSAKKKSAKRVAPKPEPLAYRRKALADALGVSEWTIDRWTKSGKFPPPIRLSNNVKIWRASTVEEWMRAREAHG